MFDDLVSIFASPPPIIIPTINLGDQEANTTWQQMAVAIATMRGIDFEYTKGVCYDIMSRLLKQPGGREAIDDAADITRAAMRALMQRHMARLN